MTTVLNVKIDDTLKREAQKAAKAMGLPLSTVVAVTLKDFVRRGYLVVTADPQPLLPEVEEELLSLAAEARQGVNVSPVFDASDTEGMKQWLNQPDDED